MNWEETIQHIRSNPEYDDLVRLSYFDQDLVKNVEAFAKSEEFLETLELIKKLQPRAKKILDIGSGNGISVIAFIMKGYEVTAIEPDPSNTVGAGAIRFLKNSFNIENLNIHEDFAENINFKDEEFDIVYARQSMHHANNLNQFVSESARVLKKGGCFITIRDHIVHDEKDKEWFLENHPLHKFYGGENAYSAMEYEKAMTKANLKIILKLKFYDSVINYYPLDIKKIKKNWIKEKNEAIKHLKSKVGILSKIPFVQNLYFERIDLNKKNLTNEKNIPGRMYSYIATKK